MNKSEMELIYENYLKRCDHTIIKHGVRFYQIVNSHHFSATGLQDYLEIILLWEYMNEIRKDERVKPDSIWIDENGNRYQVLSSAFIRFCGTVPEWYLKCGVFSVKWIDTPQIGQYIGVRLGS